MRTSMLPRSISTSTFTPYGFLTTPQLRDAAAASAGSAAVAHDMTSALSSSARTFPFFTASLPSFVDGDRRDGTGVAARRHGAGRVFDGRFSRAGDTCRRAQWFAWGR